MKSSEKRSFGKKLNAYFEYLNSNEDTLISKVYGLYKFQKSNGELPDYLFVMRNIAPIDGKYQILKFDLKGSSVDRSVLNLQEVLEIQQAAENYRYSKKLMQQGSE